MLPDPVDLTIRSAQVDDVAALSVLIDSAYRGDSARTGWSHEADLLGGQRIDHDGLAEILADPEQHLLVAARADGSLTGCVNIAHQGQGRAYLGLLSVMPTGQTKGLGKCLIAAAEAFARDHLAATEMEMTVIRQRPELIAYYQRRGYQLTGEERPFPYGDARFGQPRIDDLSFVVLARQLT